MFRHIGAASAIFCLVLCANASAQTGDEIVVTGMRLERYSSDVVPTVTLSRRADYVLISYDFICDTRDKAQRKRELTHTLEKLIAAAAKRKDIELSTLVEYEDEYDTLYFPKPYTAVDADDFVPQYGRADTSMQTVVVKTPVNDSISSLEAAEKRIKSFVNSLQMDGRTIAVADESSQLSVVDVERYRGELTAAIRKDAQAQRAALNASTIEISGLEQVVRWERAGPLDLKIYIPYKYALTIGG